MAWAPFPQATSEALISRRFDEPTASACHFTFPREAEAARQRGPEPRRPWGGGLRRGGGCGYLELSGVVVWDAVSVQAAAAAPHGVRAARLP